jgi:signal peptidase I
MSRRDTRNDEAGDRKPKAKSALAEAAEREHKGVLLNLREWIDALVIAFVLAMFIRTFVVELFKIPSGSMSPTLLGDLVAEGAAVNSDGDSFWYLLIKDRHSDNVQVFRRENAGHYTYEGRRWYGGLTTSQRDLISNYLHVEEHRIFVNKFAYWFKPPDRGDIVVFRVPFELEGSFYSRNGHDFRVDAYNRDRAVYVKRAIGLSDELVEIGNDRRLYVNEQIVEDPQIFQVLRYTIPETREYSVVVPERSVLLFGDNADASSDSRYWGPVPYENLRGKAFFRYWPIRKLRFLNY